MKDVVIVGGGVVGLFTAVRLRKAGARVTLLEAEREHVNAYGPVASAAAAGMLQPLADAPSPHDGLGFDSLDLWRRLRADAEWADGVRFDGGVAITRNADDVSALVQRSEALGKLASPLTASQFRKQTGLETKIDHAVFVADEGTVDPLRVLSGLAMQGRAHGVITHYSCDVESVTANSATANDGRTFEADVVVLAPGAWATDDLKNAAPALKHIRPGKGHLVAVGLEQPLAPNLHAPGFYIAQRREDVVLGATLEMDRSDRRRDPARVAELVAAAEAVLPGEVHVLDEAWAGIRPMSPDGWPMIGRSGDCLVAVGHSRNGWLLAPITAEIIRAYVFDAEIPPEWAALTPDRFGTP